MWVEVKKSGVSKGNYAVWINFTEGSHLLGFVQYRQETGSYRLSVETRFRHSPSFEEAVETLVEYQLGGEHAVITALHFHRDVSREVEGD